MASTLQTTLFFSIFFISRVTSKPHPLDSLTPSEFLLVRDIVTRSYPTFNHKISFHYVGLEEPEKQVVKSWLSKPSSDPPPHQALVVLSLDRKTRKLVVDLSRRTVVSDKFYDGFSYPILTVEDQEAAMDLALKHGPFLASIRRRGLNISEIDCLSLTIGWYGQVKTNRELQVKCFYLNGTVNLYLRPIEGITMVADIEQMKISEYVDRGVISLPKTEGTGYRG